MMRLMLITNQPDVAKFACDSGVDRIFVDLEHLGKHARQGHLDTVISQHSLDDVARVRDAIPDKSLLVRINPLNQESEREIDAAIFAGADLLMLPMYRSVAQVSRILKMVDGRCPVVPLIETAEAAENVKEVLDLEEINEIYIGLNDLHMDLGCQFMFEPLVDGTVERIATLARSADVAFGFGGIARIGEGTLPAELVLAEHVRLGSSAVILSRAFHGRARTVQDLVSQVDLSVEISRIREKEHQLTAQSAGELLAQSARLKSKVESIVATLNKSE